MGEWSRSQHNSKSSPRAWRRIGSGSTASPGRGGDVGRDPFPRDTLLGDPVEVAPLLLNAVITAEGCALRVVEVEAYGGLDDAASHAARGQTRRNQAMFGPPGSLYIYFTYGMHHCANVVCGPSGHPGAVLLRAAEVVDGIEVVRARRGRSGPVEMLCSGPGRLCQALGLGRAADGHDLCSGAGEIGLWKDGIAPPARPLIGVRIGLGSRSTDALGYPWRFGVPGSPALSRPFP